MFKKIVLGAFAMFAFSAFSQSVTGIWETIDDETGKAKSHVLVFENKGKIYGKVIKILDPAKKDKTCTKCAKNDPRKDKKIQGMIIVTGLKKDGNEYNGGKILDPNKGKVYGCKMWLDKNDSDKLNVRGFMGISMLGRSQTWNRVKK